MMFPTDIETRKLTAIMFTDIKGFSQKMAKNETVAFELLKTHDALLRVLAAKFDGRVIKSIGDSFMIDFASAVNAVRCAIEAQKRFSHFNKDKSELDKIEIRVGIHLGDVIIRDEDIIGDGVNIASRIEAMAGPNRIWISQDVYQQIRNKIELRVFPLGPQHLKNIPEPIEVYEILIDSIPAFATPSAKALETLAHNQEDSAQRVETEEAIEARNVEEAKQRVKQGFGKEEDQKKEIAEHYAKAERYFEEGRTSEAESELNKIYQIDPQQRIHAEHKKEAEEQEKKMQEYLQKATELFAEGQLDDAESKINEIFRLSPLHVGAQQLLGQIEEERYKIEERKRAKRIIKDTPKQISQEERHVEELMDQARALLQEEKFTEATFTLHELFAIDPNHSGARRLEETIRQTQQAKAELLRIQAKQAQEEQHLHELAKLQQKVEEQRQRQTVLRRQSSEKARQKRWYYIGAAIIVLCAGIIGVPKLLDVVFPKKASIAILQVMNAPRDTSAIEMFDALPVLLADDFSRCEYLTVIAPSSSLIYAPDQTRIQKITSLLPKSFLLLITAQESRAGYTLLIRLYNPDQQKIVSVGSVDGPISAFSEMRTSILQKTLESMEIKSKLPDIARVSNVNAYEKYLTAFHLSQQESKKYSDSAKVLLLNAVKIDPSFGAAYGLLADIQLRMFSSTNDVQLLQSASEYAQRALRCTPNSSLAYKVLGICARLQQNYNFALSSQAKSLMFAPQDPECFREFAFLSLIAGKYDDASAYAADALVYDPINAKSHFTLALAQQMKHEFPAAENSYQQALLFGENEEDLTIHYIQNVWLAEGQHNKVIDYFQKKFQSAPKDYRYCYWIGRAYQLSIQNSTAQQWLKEGLAIAQQSIETNSNDARALSFVGLFHSRLGNFSDGETAINRAIQIDSTSPEYLFRCAEIYSIQSDTQKAFFALAHALRWKYDFAELQNPDFSFIAREPEFLPAITRKFEDQWPLK